MAKIIIEKKQKIQSKMKMERWHYYYVPCSLGEAIVFVCDKDQANLRDGTMSGDCNAGHCIDCQYCKGSIIDITDKVEIKYVEN